VPSHKLSSSLIRVTPVQSRLLASKLKRIFVNKLSRNASTIGTLTWAQLSACLNMNFSVRFWNWYSRRWLNINVWLTCLSVILLAPVSFWGCRLESVDWLGCVWHYLCRANIFSPICLRVKFALFFRLNHVILVRCLDLFNWFGPRAVESLLLLLEYAFLLLALLVPRKY